MLLRWSGIMADAGRRFVPMKRFRGEKRIVSEATILHSAQERSRVNTNVQYRVMSVADNRPTRQMYGAAVVSVHDSARRSGLDVRAF